MERTLPNGLRVIVVPTGFPDLVSVQISMQTGSRNEIEPGRSGFAHFFEHMMFRGTKAYPPDAYQAVVTRIGARQNAYTSDDLTNYHLTFAKQDLEKVLEIEADRFMNLDYSVAAFQTESRAILGEYDKNASNPLRKLEEISATAPSAPTPTSTRRWASSPTSRTCPTSTSTRGPSIRGGTGGHATIVVAGDVDARKTIALVERYFGKWKRGSHRVEIPREPAPQRPVYAHVPWKTPTLPWVAVAFHGPAFSDVEKDWPAVDLLFDLHFGETSDLYEQLVVEEQKVDALFADSGANVDPGLVTVYARLKSPADVYVRDAILRTFARPSRAARRGGSPSTRRTSGTRSCVASTRRTRSAATIARHAMYDRSYQTVNRLFRTYAALTPDDLVAAARRYFRDERLVLTTLSKDPPGGRREGPRARLPRRRGRWSGGRRRWTGAGGDGPVRTAGRDDEAAVRRGQRVRRGRRGSPRSPRRQLTNGGSRRMRIDEIRDALHPLAASLEAQVDKEQVTLTGTFPRDGWERFADVALPQLTDPGFREEIFGG